MHKQSIVQYFEHAPVLNKMKLLHASMMLYYLIYREKLNVAEVLQLNHEFELADDPIDSIDLDVSNRRQNNHYHQDPAIERSLFNSIRDGNREALFKSIAALPEDNFYDQSYFSKIFKKYTTLTPKQYRNRKYLPST